MCLSKDVKSPSSWKARACFRFKDAVIISATASRAESSPLAPVGSSPAMLVREAQDRFDSILCGSHRTRLCSLLPPRGRSPHVQGTVLLLRGSQKRWWEREEMAEMWPIRSDEMKPASRSTVLLRAVPRWPLKVRFYHPYYNHLILGCTPPMRTG